MRRDKELITFELGGFNPKTGDFYFVEDGLHWLQWLVDAGIRSHMKSSRRDRASYMTRMRSNVFKVIQEALYSSDFVHLEIKFKPRFFKLLKELDKLNREVDR